jgi:hypothetical protein
LDDNFLDVHLFAIQMVEDYFSDIVHSFSIGVAPYDFTMAQTKKLVVKEEEYQLIAGNLCKLGIEGIMQRCILDHEMNMVLS